MTKFEFVIWVLVVCVSVSADTSHASIITYTDPAQFLAASANVTTIDFENLGTPTGSFREYGASGLSVAGVSFLDASPVITNTVALLATVSPTYFSSYSYGTGVVLSAQGGFPANDSVLQVNLPSAVTAIGTELAIDFGNPSHFTVQVSTGEVIEVNGGNLSVGLGFIGFTSDIPISAISFIAHPSVNSAIPVYDNFSFGQGSALVPLPPSVTLFGSAIFVLFGARNAMQRYLRK